MIIDIGVDYFDRENEIEKRTKFSGEVGGGVYVLSDIDSEDILKFDDSIVYFSSFLEAYRFLTVYSPGEYIGFCPRFVQFLNEDDKVINLDGTIADSESRIFLADNDMFETVQKNNEIPIWCYFILSNTGDTVPTIRTIFKDEQNYEIILPQMPPVRICTLFKTIVSDIFEDPEFYREDGEKKAGSGKYICTIQTLYGYRRIMLHDISNNSLENSPIDWIRKQLLY